MRVSILALGCLLILGTVAQAIPYVPNDYNALYFLNQEVWIDTDGDDLISSGDVLWGTLALNNIFHSDVDGSPNTKLWPIVNGNPVPPQEITGYFVTEVATVSAPNALGIVSVNFKAPATDPNSVISDTDLANDIVVQMYEDSSDDYDITSQGAAVSTATDGSLLWKLTLGNSGIEPFGGADTGYWVSTVFQDPLAALALGLGLGSSAFGVNVAENNGPMWAFQLVNDPNENVQNSDVQFWGRSSLGVNQIAVPTVGPAFVVGPNAPMHFNSNDPGVYYPVPEPTTLALFGLGIVGAFGLARRRRRT